jgi:hypothetical protein
MSEKDPQPGDRAAEYMRDMADGEMLDEHAVLEIPSEGMRDGQHRLAFLPNTEDRPSHEPTEE